MSDLTGISLGRYQIVEKLGQGGMATVYRAFDTRLECDVAIKFIRRQAITEENMDQMLKRFNREGKALARLTHPNIVQVRDFGEYEGSPYLVMTYIAGGTLKEKTKQKWLYYEAAAILAPIARALEYAHSLGIIHRDIKPANILLTTSGLPMLSDFGIAKVLSSEETSTLTGTGVGIGTPEYMAPEQGMGRQVDHRADIYALGIVLFELITGSLPYKADTPLAVVFKHMTDPLPRPRLYVADLPDAVEQVVFKALAKDVSERYQTMGAFAAALEKLAQQYPTQEIQAQAPILTPARPVDVPAAGSPTGNAPVQTVYPVSAPPPRGQAADLRSPGVPVTEVSPRQGSAAAGYPPPQSVYTAPVQPGRSGPKTGLIVGLILGGGVVVVGAILAAVLLLKFLSGRQPVGISQAPTAAAATRAPAATEAPAAVDPTAAPTEAPAAPTAAPELPTAAPTEAPREATPAPANFRLAARITWPDSDEMLRAVAVKNGIAYALGREGRLLVYDLSDLPMLSYFNTYTASILTFDTGNRAGGMLIVGDILYIHGWSGLTIMDISQPANPQFLAQFSDVTGIYNAAVQEDLLALVGSQGVAVVSIADPVNPRVLGTFPPDNGQTYWSVAWKGRYLFTNEFYSNGVNAIMRVLDVSSPDRIVNVFQGDLEAAEGNGYHLTVLGDRLVDCGTDQLRYWDVSDPLNPIRLWQESLPSFGRGCVVDGDRLFIPGNVLQVGDGGTGGLFQYDSAIGTGDGFPYTGASDNYFIYLPGSSGVEVISR